MVNENYIKEENKCVNHRMSHFLTYLNFDIDSTQITIQVFTKVIAHFLIHKFISLFSIIFIIFEKQLKERHQ